MSHETITSGHEYGGGYVEIKNINETPRYLSSLIMSLTSYATQIAQFIPNEIKESHPSSNTIWRTYVDQENYSNTYFTGNLFINSRSQLGFITLNNRQQPNGDIRSGFLFHRHPKNESQLLAGLWTINHNSQLIHLGYYPNNDNNSLIATHLIVDQIPYEIIPDLSVNRDHCYASIHTKKDRPLIYPILKKIPIWCGDALSANIQEVSKMNCPPVISDMTPDIFTKLY